MAKQRKGERFRGDKFNIYFAVLCLFIFVICTIALFVLLGTLAKCNECYYGLLAIVILVGLFVCLLFSMRNVETPADLAVREQACEQEQQQQQQQQQQPHQPQQQQHA